MMRTERQFMRIISKRSLVVFWGINNDAEEALKAWYSVADKASWKTPIDVKQQYKTASILKDGRVVFNIAGNKYRLVVWINYEFYTIYIRFIGTHKEYDDTDIENI